MTSFGEVEEWIVGHRKEASQKRKTWNITYMTKYIPRNSLHREIHAKIHDVPCPNGKECKKAFEELCRREREGLIDLEYDTIEQRIDFLIEMWQEDNCEATIAILKWQKQIVSKFYNKPSE